VHQLDRPFQSLAPHPTVTAGQTYFIIVDGYSTSRRELHAQRDAAGCLTWLAPQLAMVLATFRP